MKIILKQDLFVEGKDGMSIIPNGTILEALTPEDEANRVQHLKKEKERVGLLRKNRYSNLNQEQNAAHGQFDEYFVSNVKIVNKEIKKDTDEVEGQQTDVDDFDVHSVNVTAGYIAAVVIIPKELFPIQIDLDNKNFYEFIDSLDIDDLDYILAEKTGFSSSLWREYDRNSSESDMSYSCDEVTSNGVVISVNWEFNLIGKTGDDEDGGTLINKGRYRTGGNYPNA